ncbi:MAG TPA: Mov34/MPN/PAD-1 family protein [Nitrospirota bacterium]|nr:Mov34/MPN/PAD-1 family protein [Nitrospirota bacterium]
MRLTQEAIDTISKQAIAEYPSECCGIVTGVDTVLRVHALVNIQERLHAEDPGTHPRTSREAYAVDRNEVERIIGEAADRGEAVLAFYHSHIECGAYFSPMDKEVQTVFGEPEFPDAVHIVVSVEQSAIHEIKGYLWDGRKQDFVEVAVR